MARLTSYILILAPAGLLGLLFYRTVRVWRTPDKLRRPALWATGTVLLFVALDWGLVAALPELGLSFGPALPYWLVLVLVRLVLYALLVGATLLYSLMTRLRRESRRFAVASSGTSGLGLFWLLNLAVTAAVIYASYFEPFHLTVSEIDLSMPDLNSPLRIVHITDMHVERTTKRERELVELASTLEPDLIVLTGDYLNLGYLDDPIARRDTRDLLAQLDAPYGVYAVNGTVDSPERMSALFDGLDIVVLEDKAVALSGSEFYLVGVTNVNWGTQWQRDKTALSDLMGQLPEDAFTLLLYHTPDLIEAAAAEGVDLYLAGHTHGGQVRLPFYGAIFAASRYGKLYEKGLHTLGPTTLYVSRGLGMEGFWYTPRVRFLCPPEVVVLNLRPGSDP